MANWFERFLGKNTVKVQESSDKNLLGELGGAYERAGETRANQLKRLKQEDRERREFWLEKGREYIRVRLASFLDHAPDELRMAAEKHIKKIRSDVLITGDENWLKYSHAEIEKNSRDTERYAWDTTRDIVKQKLIIKISQNIAGTLPEFNELQSWCRRHNLSLSFKYISEKEYRSSSEEDGIVNVRRTNGVVVEISF